jgi:hypothetical protein
MAVSSMMSNSIELIFFNCLIQSISLPKNDDCNKEVHKEHSRCQEEITNIDLPGEIVVRRAMKLKVLTAIVFGGS